MKSKILILLFVVSLVAAMIVPTTAISENTAVILNLWYTLYMGIILVIGIYTIYRKNI